MFYSDKVTCDSEGFNSLLDLLDAAVEHYKVDMLDAEFTFSVSSVFRNGKGERTAVYYVQIIASDFHQPFNVMEVESPI